MYLKHLVLLLGLIAVFVLIYVVQVDRHCPAHPFAVEEQQM